MTVFSPCALIPVYNHERAVRSVVVNVIFHGIPCVLIDDGCNDVCAQILEKIAKDFPSQVKLLRHSANQGKGAAVMTGIRFAEKKGYSHVFQIDADGQHNTTDIPAFLNIAKTHPNSVVLGVPVYDGTIPAVRFFGRYLTHFWVWINTLSLEIKDSMCGFRVYPTAPVMSLLSHCSLNQRMAFDTDILVRLYWSGVRFINFPTKVTYPVDGVSHFRSFSDNVAISMMHARLFFGMLIRIPKLLAFKWRRR